MKGRPVGSGQVRDSPNLFLFVLLYPAWVCKPGVLRSRRSIVLLLKSAAGLSVFLVRPSVAVVPACVVRICSSLLGAGCRWARGRARRPGVELGYRCIKLPIRRRGRRCRVRRVLLIEIGAPYKEAPLLVGLDPDALGGDMGSVDGPPLPIRRLKQHFYRAVGRHQRCAQPSFA